MAAITIPIISDYNDRGVKRAQKSFRNLGKAASDVGKSIKSAMLPAAAAAGALAAVAVKATQAAIEDAASQEQLAVALRNTTKATKGQVAAVEDYISQTTLATGVTDTDLRAAFAQLARATRSTTKAQKLMNVALDVAAGTGKPLSQVAVALSRAYGGNVRALARLDPSLRNFISKTTTADQATAKLAANFAGASKRAAEGYAGQLARLRVAFDELLEQVGVALLPLFDRLVAIIRDKVIPYAEELTKVFSEQGFSGVIKAVSGDLKNFILNADGTAGVIVNLTGTVLSLIAAFQTFSIVKDVFGVFTLARGAVTALGGAFTALSGVTFAAFLSAVGLVVVTVYTLIAALRDPIFRSAFGEVLVNSAKLIANAFIFVYKVIRGGLNPLITLIRMLPGMKNAFGYLPDVDFQKFTFDANQATSGIANRAGTTPDTMGGGVTINVNGGDPQAVVDALRRYYRQSGPIPVAVQY